MIYRLVFILLLSPLFTYAQSADIPYGKWEVIAAPDSLASLEIIRSVNPYIGKKLQIKKRKFKSFFRRTGNPPVAIDKCACKLPDYKTEVQSAEQFHLFTGDHLLMFDRAANDEVAVLTVECAGNSEVGATLYILREDLLLMSYLGLNCYLRKK